MGLYGTALYGTDVYGGESVVIPPTTFSFTPPYVLDLPPVLPETRGLQRALWRYAPNRPRGRTVIKENGTYTTLDAVVLTPERVAAAQALYLGGHVYAVDEAEAASLTAAGYTVIES